jgi:chromosome segregation protein
VSGPARLQALRLQGFKSFAERTVVELVPGINAVIGPNGSGKSNLADALRWTLGEQGRALRSRRAEDVVFAGSERRAALGMADVALVLENSDGLLPVDYATVEVGRRLYRSGENEYLVNRQRVRLRDLVDLLDAANLADNAFLFIGQGMVDQALALRPEERRPLFEEVAGVRRHERRRRRAGEQLIEASANLARVEDILAELRPQVRRLAAQAEQQVSRARAADDLADALSALFAGRWHDAARSTADADLALAAARRAAASALGELRGAEDRAAAAAREVAAHVASEAARRAAHDEARAALAAIDLQAAAAVAEAAAIQRDRVRLGAEREAAAAELSTHRRTLALPPPVADHALESELAELDGALAEARAEVGALRAAGLRRDEEEAAVRRASVARTEALDALRRRVRAAEAAHRDAVIVASRASTAEAALGDAVAAARAAWEDAVSGEEAARGRAEAARRELAVADARRGALADAATAARSRASALRGRADALRTRVAADDGRSIAAAARRHGGRPLADGLDIEPAQQRAAAIALGDLGRAFVLGRDRLAPLSGERGSVVLGDAGGPGATPPAVPETEAARSVAGRRGGGLLIDAVRSDPSGAARRLLARWAWAPTLDDAVEIAAGLPAGWRVVAAAGGVAGVDGVVVLGDGDAPLERRQELQSIGAELAAADAEVAASEEHLAAAEDVVAAARDAAEAGRRAAAHAARALREAEEGLRGAERRAEQLAREAAWSASRAATLAADLAPLADRLAEAERSAAEASSTGCEAPELPTAADHSTARATAAWEARVGELTARREQVAGARARHEAERRAAEAKRARAEAAVQLAEERMARADTEMSALAAMEAERAASMAERDRARAEASARESHLREILDAVRAADAAGRETLRAAEADVAAARDRLRRAEEELRATEVRELEARLALDAVREQALVEFAGLGEAGLRALEPDAGARLATDGHGERAAVAGPADDDGLAGSIDDDEGVIVAAAVAAAGIRWAAAGPPADVPSPGQLAALRRRFHALGVANPFAAQEHEELRARVDGLEAQRADLGGAIDRTRTLMAELDELITRQFRTTFAALEVAFERQFERLFGGGFARLALTDPADISQTGVEIIARPPGKKAQALAMLSGGERALTAVALLFGMLDVRPVPFCVLDEVDAALDEANIARFVEALRDLARTTQFIVITHNRGTIEAADSLYGVTVGDDAVSHVVSLRLEEAREIAASVRQGGAGRGSTLSAG